MSATYHRCERGIGGGGRKKLIEVAEWRVDKATDCAGCRDLYADRNPPQEPPCDQCRPEVLPENEIAISLYSIVQNQWIMGPGGPVDINHLAVWEAIDRYRAPDAPGTFRKILTLSRWMLERINEKREK